MPAKELQAKKLFGDRTRTNVLRKHEQTAISALVKHVPQGVTPNMLTTIGLLGSVLVLLGLALARFNTPAFLWLSVAGLALNWLGDSLDGRLAYYRNIPRKWYGFSLDVVMDWQSTLLMGLGAILYLETEWGKTLIFLLVAMYGWAMIISQLRFKITGRYQIDSGALGPTEFRLFLSLLLILEFFYSGHLGYSLGIISSILLIINILDTKKLLKSADFLDRQETLKKKKKTI